MKTYGHWIRLVSGLIMLSVALSVSGYRYTMAAPMLAATSKQLSTNFVVQNFSTNPGDIAYIQVVYMKAANDGGGVTTFDTARTNVTLGPGQSTSVAQYFDTLVTGSWRGSATINSTLPVGAVVNQLARNQVATSGSYNGFTSGAPEFVAPLVFKNLPYGSGFQNSVLTVMNTGSADTNFRVIYISGVTFTPVYTYTSAQPLPVGESYVLDQSLEPNLPNGFYGSAVIDATSPSGNIAVIGNQFVGPNSLLTYSGFKSTDGYTSWAVPLYMCRLANGFSSLIEVQNVSGGTIAAGGISTVFTPAAGVPFTITNSADIPSNATYIINPRSNMSCPTGSNGGAVVNSTGNVVVMVNQLQVGSAAALSYNGIPTNGTATTIYDPSVMVKLSNGFSTALQVQNLTPIASTVYFNYYPDSTCTGCQQYRVPLTLPANGSVSQNMRLPSVVPAGWYGSAVVTSTVAIGGIVNQLNLTDPNGDGSTSFNMLAP